MKYKITTFLAGEIKTTHALIIAVVSLILTAISTFQVNLLGDIPVVVACGGFLIGLAIIMFLYSALDSVIDEINHQDNIKTTAGSLPKVSGIVFDPYDDDGIIKIILSDENNLIIQTNTLVSVLYSDVDEKMIGIGHILKLQSGNDKKIEICVQPLEKYKKLWESIKIDQEKYKNKMMVSCCIDKSTFPKSYLDEERSVVRELIEKTTVTEDGGVAL